DQPKRDYRKGRRYTVIRALSGCNLINNSGQIVYRIKESQIHSLNLKSGDIVEAIENRDNPNYEAEVLRVVGYRKLRMRDYDPIEEFRYAVVRGKADQLAITRNIKGEKLRIRGKDITIDRKSTRLNSSHVSISYAVFCLKKKKIDKPQEEKGTQHCSTKEYINDKATRVGHR